MHLPTINHIDLSFIRNFPLFTLTSSVVNLQRLDIQCLTCFEYSEQAGEDSSFVQSEVLPNIREFNTSDSSLQTTKLLHAKMQDGRPAFNFMGLRRVSMSFTGSDERNVRFLLQNAKLLEKLHLSVRCDWSLERLHDVISTSIRTLKILGLTVPLYSFLGSVRLPLGGLCEAVEAMAERNILETLFFEVAILGFETIDYIGPTIQKVEDVLVGPGWSALKQISFKVSCEQLTTSDLCEELQSLPDKYLSHLSKRESVAFNYSLTADMLTF